MVQDAALSSLVASLYGGVILVGFALELGATPFVIGVLAAIPFLAQVGQLPAIVLIERWRRRRPLALGMITAARVVILSLAFLPWAPPEARLPLLIAAQVVITLLGAFAGCSVNSWFHQFLAGRELGALYAQRLFWSMVLGSLGALSAGHLLERWPQGDRSVAYAACFALAALAGFIGVGALGRVPEPAMRRTGPRVPVGELLLTPLRDVNFRRLIVFIASWNFAANLAAPFLTVYLLKQQNFDMALVTGLWAASQVANALTLFAWGRLSDRLSNKAILATALPAYFGCLVALPMSTLPDHHALTLPLLWVIHVVMGMASGGIGLATGNIGLKLAPQAKGTSYLASVSLAGAVAAGIAALIGGALAGWFEARQLAVIVHLSSLTSSTKFIALQFAHWEFLFGLAFMAGVYVMHALSRVTEGENISEREVMRNFALETASSLASLFPIGRLFDRRRQSREPDLQA